MAEETVQNYRVSLGSEFSRHPHGCHENSDPENSDPENPDPENSDPENSDPLKFKLFSILIT